MSDNAERLMPASASDLPPGVMVKYPPLCALMAAHAWITSASSGAQ